MGESKQDQINRAQANLPLPEQPPAASDWQSLDERNVNVGSGRFSDDVSRGDGSSTGLREPVTKGADADMSGIGRQGKDNLNVQPDDPSSK